MVGSSEELFRKRHASLDSREALIFIQVFCLLLFSHGGEQGRDRDEATQEECLIRYGSWMVYRSRERLMSFGNN